MPEHALSEFIQRLRRVTVLRGGGEVLDAELLERFVTGHEEAAFEALVQRHGPMVLSVCRHLLVDTNDAEDAFQATFLVLVRKARSIQRRAQLASWLYGVAYRIARRARQNSARRRAREKQGVEMMSEEPCSLELGTDLRPALHEELTRLPEKYRVPVVLCYLQGKTHEEAARQLSWPLGTVKGRLTRAREMLRKRLTRRGLVLSLGGFASLLAQSQASAALPPALLSATVKAATLVATGQAATAGIVSAHVAALTKGVLHTMFVKKLTIASMVLLTMGLVTTGGVLLTYYALPAHAGEAKKAARPAPAAQVENEAKKEDDKDTEETDRQNNINALKLLMLAMHNYHDVNKHFPPAAVYANDGKPLLSWRVLVLPYVDQDDLFKQFELEEPWDSEHNKKLLTKMPKIYAPVRGKNKDSLSTHYQVFTGKGTVFEGTQGLAITDITDGTSTTIAIVEAAEAVPWTKPADLTYDPEKPLPKLGGMFKDVFHAAFADGSVHTLKREFDEHTMRLAITANDGEVLDLSKIHADQ
jgi:RNA polymerase sigma factor (sigma-70 family)